MNSAVICADNGIRESANENLSVCPLCCCTNSIALLMAPDRFHLRKEKYSLLRCLSCGAVWQATPPRPEDMQYHYTPAYHHAIVAAGEGAAHARWKSQVKLISRLKSGGSILDIGCSSGAFLSAMRGPAWELHGIEMEPATAERARASTSAEVFVGDVMAAPYPPNRFDVITCFDVLEHVYDPRQFLTKVQTWLKPDGILYLTTPNIDAWEARLLGSYWFGLEQPRHLTLFSPHSLRVLMTDVGLTQVIVRTPAASYIERSVRYIGADLAQKLGFQPTPQATPKPVSLPWKIFRKGIRIAVVAPIAHISSLAQAGPVMEAVFRRTIV